MQYGETERLILRTITRDDASDVYEYASDDETIEHLTFQKHTSIAMTYDTLDNFFLNRKEKGLLEATCIELKENHEVIGMCEFAGYDANNQTAEIGYVLKKKYWGQGYMVEAVRELIRVGFEQFGLRKIDIGHFVENKRSQRVIEKIGFHYDGCLRQQVKDGKGNYHDEKVYSILKSEYESRENK